MNGKLLEEAIRALSQPWVRPNRLVYWSDFGLSTATGWLACGSAVASHGWLRGSLFMVSAFALYRAALSIHEMTHLARRDVLGFTTVVADLVHRVSVQGR